MRDAFVSGNLAAHDGRVLYTAGEAMLKGMLESEREISFVAGPDGAFAGLFDAAKAEKTRELLKQHGMAVMPTMTAKRALTLTTRRLRREPPSSGVVAFVPNGELAHCLPELTHIGQLQLSGAGSYGLVLEDTPRATPALCPRQLVHRLGIPCIEPTSVAQLRDALEHAMRLSRADSKAVAVVVHEGILRSSQTLEARPNRVASVLEPTLLRRRRQRVAESGGMMRLARRLELNRVRAMPSPGERVPVGFMTIGSSDAALQHLTHALRLYGRIPVLQLGLIVPLDHVLLDRFLGRCQRVVVLEARPGSVESIVIAAAEMLRHRGSSPAEVWGTRVPTSADEPQRMTQVDDNTHVSLLARHIAPMLHPLRPTLQVTSQLAVAPPKPPFHPPPRGARIGVDAARDAVLQLLGEVDQRVRADIPAGSSIPRTAIAIDGAIASVRAERIVPVETWLTEEFRAGGSSAMAEAAGSGEAQVFVVIDLDTEPGEMERFIRANISAKHAEELTIVPGNFNEMAAMRDALLALVETDQFSIVLVRDGPPPQFDLVAIDGMLADTDRLGFEPRQWVIRTAEQVCALRQEEKHSDESEYTGRTREPANQRSDSLMRTSYSFEKLTKRQSTKIRLKVQPMMEQVEVIRTRPPAWIWRSEVRYRPDLPTPIHGKNAQWRVHLAGYRGRPPGLAPRALCEAGRIMGYEVSELHDATHIAPGRRAWSQVLFTQRLGDDDEPRLTTHIPYGEADVLIGLDAHEALRSVIPDEPLRVAHRDRTAAIINCGSFQADANDSAPSQRRVLLEAFGAVSRDDHCVIEDYATACRTWFYTDRVTDLALLGAAFQRGLIPVRLDAMEMALRTLETRQDGVGRAREAFEFGRCLAVDERLLSRQRGQATEPLGRVVRRIVLSVRGTRWGGRTKARKLERLLEQCLTSTPGLSETAPGRQARRDMVASLYRCMEWGGYDYADRYAQLLMDLYRVDRGDTGRCITRDAVLPLAEAMLIRDHVFIATMARSLEQRRRFRLHLNVKQARGDRVERRYLTRLELIAFSRRYRADIRTSDWPARLARASRFLLPHRWRGMRRDREVREYLINLVQQARHGCEHDYERWSEIMQRLHHHAELGTLRLMAPAEIRMLAEPESAGV